MLLSIDVPVMLLCQDMEVHLSRKIFSILKTEGTYYPKPSLFVNKILQIMYKLLYIRLQYVMICIM